jgi:hypothetical protein
MPKAGFPDPETPDQWQLAVDAAAGCLALVAALQYGLIEGGPEFDPDRCREILARGEILGYLPAADAGALLLRGMLEEQDRRATKGRRSDAV